MINCKRCGKNFDYICKLERHLNNKFICNPVLSNITIEELKKNIKDMSVVVIQDNNKKLYKCKYCKKLYSNSSSKCKHQKKCKELHTSKNNYFPSISDASSTIINNINTTNIDNSINNQNVTNNNNITNQFIINCNKDETSINKINELLNLLNIQNKIKSFPTYTLGYLLDKKFENLISNMYRCQKEDKNPTTCHRSNYNFALELFKEVLNSPDYRTKNAFIAEVTDNVAYCFLDGKFYSISLEDFFNIVFQHFHLLFKQIIKIKDTYNGFSSNDKEYIDFTYAQFKEYLDYSDKVELKKEIINCLYKNKEILQELLNSATPLDKFNNLDKRTINFNSNLINKLRKKYGLDIVNDELNEKIFINDTNIVLRDRDSNEVTINIDDAEPNIIIKENTIFKVTPNGYKLYKAKYKGFDILYDVVNEVGLVECLDNKQIIKKDALVKLVDTLSSAKVTDEKVLESLTI